MPSISPPITLSSHNTSYQTTIKQKPVDCATPAKSNSNFNWSGFSQAALAIGGLALGGYGMYTNYKIQHKYETCHIN